ncbi:MAG TPA: hypothetical protein VER33_05150 [Polyangiaceae bacterium]|nr:hypothetical protein [Polyangiaceae bacterium]
MTYGRALFAGAVALGAAACGGDDAGRPETRPAPVLPDSAYVSRPADCSLGEATALELLVLDDFELGAASGGWYTNNDVCEPCQLLIEERIQLDIALDQNPTGADLLDRYAALAQETAVCRRRCEAYSSPTLFEKPLPAERIPGTRCGSTYALRTRGGPFAGWGTSLGVQLSPPVDASDWDGIAFWARRAPEHRGVVRLEVVDGRTSGAPAGPEQKPFCNPNHTDDTLREACDKFGTFINVPVDWQLFTIPWADLLQGGWGVQAPRLERDDLRAMAFQAGRGSWDLWFDDVGFYRRAGQR